MDDCFICGAILRGERTQVYSSFTPHSNVSYMDKIGELLGDQYMVIVTPQDYICKNCTSALNHMDHMENELVFFKTLFGLLKLRG